MRLGLSSYALRYAAANADAPMDALSMLTKGADLGAEVIQFCDNMPLDDLSLTERSELRSVARERGMAIEVGTGGLDQERLERYIQIAVQMGSRALRLVPYSADAEAIRGRIKALLPALREADILLAIENRFGLGSAALMDLVRSLDDAALGFCIDTGNSIGLLERPVETVANLAPLAIQMHLKDHIVDKIPVGYQITGRPLGEGWLDIPRVLETLGPRKDAVDYLLEFWMDPEDSLAATLDKEARWAARCVSAARHYLAGDEGD